MCVCCCFLSILYVCFYIGQAVQNHLPFHSNSTFSFKTALKSCMLNNYFKTSYLYIIVVINIIHTSRRVFLQVLWNTASSHLMWRMWHYGNHDYYGALVSGDVELNVLRKCWLVYVLRKCWLVFVLRKCWLVFVFFYIYSQGRRWLPCCIWGIVQSKN